MAVPPKNYVRRHPPQKIEPPPIIYHAPQGLGGVPPHEPRRLRTMVIVIGAWGLMMMLALAERDRRCRDSDPNDPAASCPSSGHAGGGSSVHGGGYSSSYGGGQSAATFGGFGATGESGAHSGGFGGGHGGGE
jgi:hypothetical protein